MANDTPQVAYIEMTEPQGSAEYGKMRPGRIYRVSGEYAGRLLGMGLATESSEGAYRDQTEVLDRKIEERQTRAGDFAALNQDAAAAWDVSTGRDVTTAPEEGIRAAFAAGRLVNTDRLTDEDGDPLPADAELEQILAARVRLQANEAPFTDHERSSVMGGGGHTHVPGGVANEGGTLSGAVPLHKPSRELTPAQRGNAPASDDSDDSDDAPARGRGRARR